MHNNHNIFLEELKSFKKLLTENVNRRDIIDAIENRKIVKIYYSGYEDDAGNLNTTNRGYRTIEPYALGVSTSDNLVLRAWQQNGATDSGVAPKRQNDFIPGWRLFRLDGITDWRELDYTFPKVGANGKKQVRPNYNPEESGKNAMKSVIISVDPNELNKDIDVDGLDSPSKTDQIMNNISAFDPQTEKLKSFYDSPSNRDEIFKRKIGSLWLDVKTIGKRDPSKYIVVKNDSGKITAVPASDKNTNQYKEKNAFIGNLNDLARKLNAITAGQKLATSDVKKMMDQSLINKKKQEFYKAINK